MKICVISNDPYPPKGSGGGIRTSQFVHMLSEFGHEVCVYILDPRWEITEVFSENLVIKRCSILQVPFLFWEDFDVVLNMDPVILNLVAPLLSKIKHIPLISDFQDPIDEWRVMRSSVGREIFGGIFRSSSYVITTHETLKEQLIKQLHVSPDRVVVVNNGVDLMRFRPMDLEKTIDVLYTGSPFSYGELLEGLREKCRGSGNRFLWTPRDVEYRIGQLPRVINKSRVCVLPAENGHWHNKLMEYLACGCPVVALETEQTRKVVRDGVNGLLTSAEDEFIEAVFYLLDNEVVLEKMAKNCRNSVIDYSWRDLSRQVEGCIKMALDDGGIRGM